MIDRRRGLGYLLAVAVKTDKKDKQIDKELKAPDQFVSFWSKVGEAASARWKQLVGGLLAAVLVVLVAWGIQSFTNKRAESSSAAFARIQRVATAPLIPATGDAPKPEEDGVPHFKTEKERLEAALKEADSFLGAYGGSSLRQEAEVLKARYLVALGRGAEAITIYNGLTGSLDKDLRFLAQEGLGYAYESAGQTDKALEAFGALADQAKQSGNFLRDRALFNKARLLERKGAGKDAEKTYREILSEMPTSALKEEINDRLAVLEGK